MIWKEAAETTAESLDRLTGELERIVSREVSRATQRDTVTQMTYTMDQILELLFQHLHGARRLATEYLDNGDGVRALEKRAEVDALEDVIGDIGCILGEERFAEYLKAYGDDLDKGVFKNV